MGVFLFSHKPLDLAGLKLANLLPNDDRLASAVIGRWDQVGSTGFMRFSENGWFRSEISGLEREGTFQVLDGGGIEFTVSYRVQNSGTGKAGVVKEIREYKYTLERDTLKLRIGSVWVTFKKSSEVPEQSPEPVLKPMLAPSPAASPPVPAAPAKPKGRVQA